MKLYSHDCLHDILFVNIFNDKNVDMVVYIITKQYKFE